MSLYIIYLCAANAVQTTDYFDISHSVHGISTSTMPPTCTRKYTIAGKMFSSKKQIEENCRKAIEDTENNTRIPIKHRAFVNSILSYHRDWSVKSLNMSHIVVDTASRNTRCFYIVEKGNRSREAISWTKSIDLLIDAQRGIMKNESIQKAYRKQINKALRCLIQPQIKEFRNKGKSTYVKCRLTGKSIRRYVQTTHVDHIIQFKTLKDNWMQDEKITYRSILKKSPPICISQGNMSLKSRKMCSSWQEYHRKHARLRFTTKTANLKRKKARKKM